MAHNLAFRADGTAAFAYVGDKAWHGLGNQLQSGASIEDWQKAAMMDFTIQRATVRYATAAGQDSAEWATMPSKQVLLRSDTKAPLGIVSENYKIVQPAEVLEFFRDLASDNGFTLETAGVLFDGKRFWALAKVGEDSYVAESSDKVKAYLLLVTSADGTLATEGRFVCTRVVCDNTMQMAMGEGAARAKISHRSVFSERDMKQKLGLVAGDAFESTMDNLRKLARTRLSPDQMINDTVELFYPGTFDSEGRIQISEDKFKKQTRAAPVERVARMAVTGRDLIGANMAGMAGTGYGWLNAVTQYTDHEARAQKVDNRLNSALFGDGAKQKMRAMQMAMQHVDGTVTYEEVTETVEAEPAPLAMPDSFNTGVLGGDGADFAALLGRPVKTLA